MLLGWLGRLWDPWFSAIRLQTCRNASQFPKTVASDDGAKMHGLIANPVRPTPVRVFSMSVSFHCKKFHADSDFNGPEPSGAQEECVFQVSKLKTQKWSYLGPQAVSEGANATDRHEILRRIFLDRSRSL